MDAKSRIEEEVAKQVSKDIASLMDREFASKTDPYNKPWKPRKKDGIPFDNRDSIRSSIRVESMEVKLILLLQNRIQVT